MATKAKAKKAKGAERPEASTLPGALDVLLSRLQCQVALGVSGRYFTQLLSSGDFPPPDTRFGKFPRWRTSTVNAWIQRRCESGQGV